MVDDLPGHHQPVAAVGIGGVRLPPAAVVGHPALHVPVVAQRRLELDDPGLAARIGVLDGVGEDLHQGQVQCLPVVGGGIEPAQPPRESIPRYRQAGPYARQFQAQGRDRIGEQLDGQRGDVVGAAGARQQLHRPLAHSFRRGGTRGQRQGLVGGHPGDRTGGRHGELGHALGDGPVRPFDEAVAVQQDQFARGERAGREDRRRAGAQRSCASALKVPGRPVDADDQRRRMSAGGIAEFPARRIEHRQGERGGPQGRHAGGERIRALQDLPEVGLRGEEFGQHGAQLSHRRRGGDPVSHHVTNDQRDAAAGQRDRIEPVAAG